MFCHNVLVQAVINHSTLSTLCLDQRKLGGEVALGLDYYICLENSMLEICMPLGKDCTNHLLVTKLKLFYMLSHQNKRYRIRSYE